MHYPNRQDELDLFRTINLKHFAISVGYEEDPQRSSSSDASKYMRRGEDRVVIGSNVGKRGGWGYFTIGAPENKDYGDIMDFVKHKLGISNMGQCRKLLRPWLGLPSEPPKRSPKDASRQDAKGEPIRNDQVAILAQFAALTPIRHSHAYLETERCIPREVLQDPRFAGSIYTDRYHNAVFPHRDRDVVSGMELRNFRFRGFSKGGYKGLWLSNIFPEDTALIVVEAGIDSVSYHALHWPEHARYGSIAGQMSDLQRDLLAAEMGEEKFPQGRTVIAATDHDAGGEKLAGQIREIAESTRRVLEIIVHRPETPGEDWNDVQKARVNAQQAASLSDHWSARNQPRPQP